MITRVLARWRSFYGGHPMHLVGLLGALALAGYAALSVASSPSWLRMLTWFGAAILAHDLVAFPLYAATDRLLTLARPGPSVNYLRVPLLGVGLTFLLFFPGIIKQGTASTMAATGLDQSPYLTRWLLLCAAMFATSALVYLLNRIRTHLTKRSAGPPEPAAESEPVG